MLSRHLVLVACSAGLVLGVAAAGAAAPQAPGASRNKPEAKAGTGALKDGVLDVTSVIRQAYGLSHNGDELVGIGPGYGVRFDARGFEFRPAVRKTAKKLALRFRLLSVGRQSSSRRAVGAATRSDEGNTVRYARPGVVETYEVRADGLKQSFVFAKRPPGSGDLVVRGRIDTELALARANASEILFEAPGLGAVRIGAVTGVDARGATVGGALRYDDGALEMSLPASFVDRAALPITLDPLLGSEFTVGSAGRPDVDVAYHAGSQQYLVVWTDGTGLGPGIIGQRVAADGSLQGSAFIVLYFWAEYPRVASVASGGGAFVVVGTGFVYYQGSYTRIATVGAGRAAEVRPTPWLGEPQEPADIGAELSTTHDMVPMAWVRYPRYGGPGKPSIVVTGYYASSVTFSPSITLDTGLFLGSYLASPRISSSGGSAGRYLITWNRYFGPFPSTADIWGAVVDRHLNILVPAFPIADSNLNEFEYSVDGDGTNWVVAYTREEAVGSADHDVVCRGVTYDPRSGTAYLTPAEVVVEGDPGFNEYRPSVAWTGDSYLIGYVDEYEAPDYDIYVKSMESFDCGECEGEFAVALELEREDHVEIASQRGGGGGDEALIVWEHHLPGGIRRVVARRFRADDGLVTDLGGGCGQGGKASATCARRQAPAFGLRVQHAAPTSAAWLVLGFSRANFPCGPCTLVPTPLALLATATDAHGNASVTTPLPNDPGLLGLKLITQWIVAAAPGPCGAGIDLSNALEVEIQ